MMIIITIVMMMFINQFKRALAQNCDVRIMAQGQQVMIEKQQLHEPSGLT